MPLYSLGIWEYTGYFWFRCFRQVALYLDFLFLKTKTGTHKNIHFLTCHAISIQSKLLILRQWDKNFYRPEQRNIIIIITKFTHWSFFTHPFLILWSLRPDCVITILLMFVRVTWDAFSWLGKTGDIWFTELNFSRHQNSSLTLRRLMSYTYAAPILDVSRSHTTTQHSL